MKKHITLLIILISLLASCEKDDICLEETTPKLIIRFYDIEDIEELKKVSNLKVEIEGIDGSYLDESITTLTDSIAIPIKTTDDITKFKLTITEVAEDDTTSENEDIIDLNYTRIDKFVSRSCGYKTLYNDVTIISINDDNNWIKLIETTEEPLNILNEKSAHVKIFH